jgi:hypothetical protein
LIYFVAPLAIESIKKEIEKRFTTHKMQQASQNAMLKVCLNINDFETFIGRRKGI